MFKFETMKSGGDDKPATVKLQTFNVHSYAELMAWVRLRSTKFSIADLEVTVCDVKQDKEEKLLYREEDFDRLRTDTEYELKVKSLSMPFSSFTSFDSVRAYAVLVNDFTTKSTVLGELPEVNDTKILAAHSRIATSTLVAIMAMYSSNPGSEMFSRELISPIWREAVAISNAELTKIDTTAMPPSCAKIPVGADLANATRIGALDQLRYEYETQVAGRRAHGALDMIVFVKYSILVLL